MKIKEKSWLKEKLSVLKYQIKRKHWKVQVMWEADVWWQNGLLILVDYSSSSFCAEMLNMSITISNALSRAQLERIQEQLYL